MNRAERLLDDKPPEVRQKMSDVLLRLKLNENDPFWGLIEVIDLYGQSLTESQREHIKLIEKGENLRLALEGELKKTVNLHAKSVLDQVRALLLDAADKRTNEIIERSTKVTESAITRIENRYEGLSDELDRALDRKAKLVENRVDRAVLKLIEQAKRNKVPPMASLAVFVIKATFVTMFGLLAGGLLVAIGEAGARGEELPAFVRLVYQILS